MAKKILILSLRDTHGDGLVAYRMTKCLIEAKYEVALVTRYKTKPDSFIYQVGLQPLNIYSRLYLKFLNKFFGVPKEIITDKKYDFALNQETREYVKAKEILAALPFVPDLILSALVADFVNTTTLSELKARTGAKLYTLNVDMAPLTGGCHHAWNCDGYERFCEYCPAILDESKKDHAHKNFMIKLNNVRKSNLKIIAGSGYTYKQAKKSTLYKNQEIIHNINSVIDTTIFNSRKKSVAKTIFDIADAQVIFTGAEHTNNERKGMKYFIESLNLLWGLLDADLKKEVIVLIAGKDKNELLDNEIIKKIPFRKVFIDFINDERLLSLAYQAADIFVCPSIEDPGPVMVSQALACGTPVVAFDMGVASNMVISGYNGYKAELKNCKDMADGLKEVLSLSKENYKKYSQNAVTQVEKFSSTNTFVNIINQVMSEVI